MYSYQGRTASIPQLSASRHSLKMHSAFRSRAISLAILSRIMLYDASQVAVGWFVMFSLYMRSSFAHLKGLSGFHGSEVESVLTLEPYRSLEEPGWGWERGSKLLKDLNASSSNEKRWYPFPKPVEDLGRDPYQLGTAPGICCGFRGCRDFAAWDVGPRQGSLPQGRIRPTRHRSNKPGIKYARLGVACLSVQSGQLKLPSLQATPSTQQACRFFGGQRYSRDLAQSWIRFRRSFPLRVQRHLRKTASICLQSPL